MDMPAIEAFARRTLLQTSATEMVDLEQVRGFFDNGHKFRLEFGPDDSACHYYDPNYVVDFCDLRQRFVDMKIARVVLSRHAHVG
jgi:hypothetical protein